MDRYQDRTFNFGHLARLVVVRLANTWASDWGGVHRRRYHHAGPTMITIVAQTVMSSSREFTALTPGGVLVYFLYGRCAAIASRQGWRFIRFEAVQNFMTRSKVINEMELRIEQLRWLTGQEWVMSSEKEWTGLEALLGHLAPDASPESTPLTVQVEPPADSATPAAPALPPPTAPVHPPSPAPASESSETEITERRE